MGEGGKAGDTTSLPPARRRTHLLDPLLVHVGHPEPRQGLGDAPHLAQQRQKGVHLLGELGQLSSQSSSCGWVVGEVALWQFRGVVV